MLTPNGAALSPADSGLLTLISRGEPLPRHASGHLVRLELMGLVLDEAAGARLTAKGERALRGRTPTFTAPAPEARAPDKVDSRGRRHGRSSKRILAIV